MSADYNLYIKKDYPEPDECIYGISTGDCFDSNIIRLLFQIIQERDCVRDEWNDIRLCKVCRRDFIAVRELLLYDDDADELKQTIDKLDVECPEYVVSIKEIYKLRKELQKLSNDKWEWFKRTGCSDRYLQGKAHAYSIVVDMIDDLMEDNLGDDTNA